MARYKRKPFEAEAIQFTGDNQQEIWDAFGKEGLHDPHFNPELARLVVTTRKEGTVPARPKDWIVPDMFEYHTFLVFKPDEFDALFEPVVKHPRILPNQRRSSDDTGIGGE